MEPFPEPGDLGSRTPGCIDAEQHAQAGCMQVGFWRSASQVSGTSPTSGGGTQTGSQSFCYDALSRLVWADNSYTLSHGEV